MEEALCVVFAVLFEVERQWELALVERGVKKARTGDLRRGCVVVGVVFVLVPPPWV